MLSKGLKDADVQAIDKTLQDIVFLFGILKSKEIFEAFYCNGLATRLLSGTSVTQLESSFIMKLKDVSSCTPFD